VIRLLSLHVRDTGVGIVAGDIDIIFQEFGQVHIGCKDA
jgi:signal transduction histidine kinase